MTRIERKFSMYYCVPSVAASLAGLLVVSKVLGAYGCSSEYKPKKGIWIDLEIDTDFMQPRFRYVS